MKRLMALLMVLCCVGALLTGCSQVVVDDPAEDPTKETTLESLDKIWVGFGRVDITPPLGTKLSGMGDDAKRQSTDIESRLYLTCIAVTDELDNTLLLMTADSIRTETWVCDAMRTKISDTLNVPRINIIYSTTHTHFAPDSADSSYTKQITDAGLEACRLAMEDRKAATMEAGTTQSSGLNFVRHILLSDGSYFGDGYGDPSGKTRIDYETKVDEEVQLIRFIREGGKDIVMMNWRAHPVRTGKNYTSISAGYVGHCRDEMESVLDCHFAYFQGASGNVKDTSYMGGQAAKNMKEQGQMLAQCAIAKIKRLAPMKPGPIEVKTVNYLGNVRVDSQEFINAAFTYQNIILNGGTKAEAIAATGGLCNSGSAIQGIRMRRQAYKEGNGKFTLELAAVSIGEVAFISTPNEMFDNTGKQIKDASPFEQTFVLYLANGRGKYLPSEPAYTHGCYEKELSYFVKGTAEEIADVYTDMLHELFEEGMADPAIDTFDSKLPNDT